MSNFSAISWREQVTFDEMIMTSAFTKDFKISQGCNIKGKEQKLVGSESGKYVREE
jgi:hypothetical protein